MGAPEQPYEGACSCGGVRFRMETAPMVVHCCHCRLCQRQTGSAFAVNALVETDRLTVLEGRPARVTVGTQSGAGQDILRCPDCQVALWSHYGRATDRIAFVRVGTLDEAHLVAPDVHIHLASKQPWVIVPEDAQAYAGYYPTREVWPEEAIARRNAVLGK